MSLIFVNEGSVETGELGMKRTRRGGEKRREYVWVTCYKLQIGKKRMSGLNSAVTGTVCAWAYYKSRKKKGSTVQEGHMPGICLYFIFSHV
jgi:hypothetical protein